MLRFTSLQAENSYFLYQGLAPILARRAGLPVVWDPVEDWRDQQRRLLEGDLEVSVVCGCHYVRDQWRDASQLELLGCPVMADARYQDRPVYFSDVLVRRETPAATLEDLAGARFGFNEEGSHSGYQVMLWALAERGLHREHFGQVVEVGAHSASLRGLLEGSLDVAAIDSTMLEIERLKDPSLDEKLRSVVSLGPSPAPPFVAGPGCPPEARRPLRDALEGLHNDPEAAALLARAGMRRIARVEDRDYDGLRTMCRLAEGVDPGPRVTAGAR